MSETPKEWSKCTVAELKAELTKRGFKTTGNKLQLVNLLKEDDEKEKQPEETEVKQELDETDTQEESEETEVNQESEETVQESAEKPDEVNGMEIDKETASVSTEAKAAGLKKVDEPQLSKGHFTTFYLADQALKTVMIKPFRAEFICPALAKWVAESREFKIRKDADGRSAAVLVMKSIEEGDAAFAEMKSEFGDNDVEVYHLSLNPKYEHAEDKTFDAIFKDSEHNGHYVQRQVIMENLPESVTEQTLTEMFPEAYNVATYRLDPITRGIATMEFPTVAKVEEIIKQNADLTIEGAKVMVNKLSTRQNKWSKKRKAAAKKFGDFSIKPDDYHELTDDERLAKCEEFQNYKAEMDAVQDREDIFGREKLAEHERLVTEWKKVSEILKYDTDRRIKAKKLPLPEPEEMYTGHTKALILGKPKDDAGNDKKEDGKPKHAKGAEAKKRASTTSSYKGSPPQKKQNFSGYSKFKARGGSTTGFGGNQQRYGNRSAGSGSRSAMGSGMGGGMGSSNRSAMGSGYGMGRMSMNTMSGTSMGSGYRGRSEFNRGSSGYGDGGYDYDGPTNPNAMESMIMNLTDKLSRLERMQMANTSQSEGYSSGYNRGPSNYDRSGFNRGGGGFSGGNTGYGYNNW